MKLPQLEEGEIQLVRVLIAGGDPIPGFLGKGIELSLWRPEDGEEVAVRVGREVALVEGATARDRRAIESLCTTSSPRITWVVDANAASRELVLQVHTFAGHVRGTLEIAVDEKAIDDVRRVKPSLYGPTDALRWLADECLLPVPAGGAGALSRAFLSAGSGRDLEGAFALHARTARVLVRREAGAEGTSRYFVERVIRGRGDRGSVFLADGEIDFVDATVAGRMRSDVQAQLALLGEGAPGFMDLWTKWRETEANALLVRARALGVLAYDRFEEFDDQCIFYLSEQAQQRLDPALRGEDLEAAAEPPPILTTLDMTWDEYEASERRPRKSRQASPFVGSVVEVRTREGALRFKRTRASDDRPPARGVLFLSIMGDRTRLRRQREATDAIRRGTNPMCQLGLLLEDLPVSPGRAGTLAPLSREVRKKIFGPHGPTPKQVEALEVALNTPDVALIQGPPGTGKTTVITALVERLNELADDGDGVAGRFLLSAFQHDAVLNAISRLTVNGLPAIKFGGRQGADEDEDATDVEIDRWCQERAAALRKLVPSPSPSALEDEISSMVTGYLLAPMPRAATGALLARIAERVAGHVPSKLVEELRAQRRVLADQGGGRDDGAELVRRVRAIRTTEAGFADDGALTAHLALRALRAASDAGTLTLEEGDWVLLERAAGFTERGAPPVLPALAVLRRRLLLRLAPSAFPDAQPRLRTEVARLLAEVRDALASRATGTRDAIDEAAAELLAAYEGDPEHVKRSILGYMAVYAATCQQSARLFAEHKRPGDSYDTVIVDEAARANPLDLFIPLAQAGRRIVLVGDHRQLPHILDRQLELELEQALRRDASPVAERTKELLSRSLFERLFENLSRRQERGEARRVVTLDEQYRMHPVLGDFVNREFYAPHPGEGFRSPLPAARFEHDLPGFVGPAAWLDVPRDRGLERSGSSKARPAEAVEIAATLKRLIDSDAGRTLNFGIITFYKAQVEAISEELRRAGFLDEEGQIVEPYRDLIRPGDKRVERLRFGTVDAFQGMEFDVVFLSMVRSNMLPDRDEPERRRKYGHLSSPNRLCVSMSRQKRLLVVAGDAAMLREPNAELAIGPLVRFHHLSEEVGRAPVR